MTTNVPSVTFGPNGFIAPAAPLVLVGVQADITAAFGTALNYNLNTPQGQLSSSFAATIVNTNATFLYYTTQTDPAFATGRMQDAIGRIYFMERLPEQPTLLTIQCFGLVGVVIPVGAIIIDAGNNLYTATDAATIGSNGNITTQFAANVAGPTVVPNTVSIYQAIPGWNSASVVSGIVGQVVESRAQFENRRQLTVAANANGTLSAIRGRLLNGTAGVVDAYVTENDATVPVTVGGVLLAPKSLYVAAVGGLAQDVANTIWSKKPPGAAYNGSTTVTVFDTNSGYSPPLPSYQVSFQRPSNLSILYNVLIANGPLVPSDATTQIQNALINAFAGNVTGIPRASIGSTLYANVYASVIASLGVWAQIASLTIGSRNTASASITGRVLTSTLTVDSVISGTLAVGQTLSDGSGYIPSGVRILTQLGGTVGGIGTYQLNGSLTLGASISGQGTGVILTVLSGTGVISVGQVLSGGTGVPANTTILQQLTGTIGATGTYQLSGSIGVPTPTALKVSDPIILAPNTGTSVIVRIDQEPTLNAADIVVNTT